MVSKVDLSRRSQIKVPSRKLNTHTQIFSWNANFRADLNFFTILSEKIESGVFIADHTVLNIKKILGVILVENVIFSFFEKKADFSERGHNL